MGCVGSKGDINDKHPNVFRVVNVNHEGEDLWSGQLEVTSANLTLYRKRKPPTQWQLQCLRRYGYENDTFIFEAGRRCLTGEGIYSFRCRRAEALFNLLQEYIQESTYNNNNNHMTVTSLDEVQQAQERMEADVAELRRGMGNNNNNNQTSGSNYIVLNGNNSGGQLASQSSPLRSTSPSRINSPLDGGLGIGANNYLEPLSNSCHNSPASAIPNNTSPTAPNASSNIYTNSMMVPAGNVYQQLALAQSSPGNTAKTAAETPLGSSSPAASSSNNARPMSASQSLMRIRSIMSTEEVNSPTSPVGSEEGMIGGAHNTYMNVTPGEMVLMSSSSNSMMTSTTSNGTNGSAAMANWRYSRMNSNASTTTITERCYENFDPSVLAALGQSTSSNNGLQLVNSSSSNAIISATCNNNTNAGNGRAGRHSRPDIFSKVDLPMLANLDGTLRMSEPCTPTAGGATGTIAGMMNAQRKVNYIVLDLDNQSGTSSSASGVSAAGGTGGGGSSNNNSTSAGGGTSISNLLTPDSPKRQTLGYATIDFNKTVALSNSTNPTCESEASRKTRF